MRRRFFLLGALCLVAASAVSAAAQSRQYVQGQAVGIGGRRAGLNRPFNLTINNYTSPDDVQRLNQALRSGGQEELLSVLSKLNAGRIALGNNVGVTANAVIATPAEGGGTKLTVLYERNVAIFELRYGTRSADYRFGYAEIYLDSRGRGQGTFIPSAKVRLEGDNNWVVEDFAEFPARLMGLRSSGRVGVAR
ncbi:MAG: hypothetical protein JOZ96_24900 [Acidobacteria bacterium]|nr:hypothetical protein [Acidobacteriota bacterium]